MTDSEIKELASRWAAFNEESKRLKLRTAEILELKTDTEQGGIALQDVRYLLKPLPHVPWFWADSEKAAEIESGLLSVRKLLDLQRQYDALIEQACAIQVHIAEEGKGWK